MCVVKLGYVHGQQFNYSNGGSTCSSNNVVSPASLIFFGFCPYCGIFEILIKSIEARKNEERIKLQSTGIEFAAKFMYFFLANSINQYLILSNTE